MVDWQTVVALTAVGGAVSYLAWRGWRSWRGAKSGCGGGGCGTACGGTDGQANYGHGENRAKVHIPREDLGLRRRGS
jgi:hypothetical protein